MFPLLVSSACSFRSFSTQVYYYRNHPSRQPGLEASGHTLVPGPRSCIRSCIRRCKKSGAAAFPEATIHPPSFHCAFARLMKPSRNEGRLLTARRPGKQEEVGFCHCRSGSQRGKDQISRLRDKAS
ncbi:hypothetical protein GQ53DRAFT_58176 [Thozetella sp. PMI_491]|nr:hypothetical protein GQ53DRAFT_58176 [Thozetella sp. PMI_491]